MIGISCENIELSFGSEQVIKNVSFALNEGERLGIVGVNGAGKTSLFRIITGEYTADSGNVYVAKEKTLGILEQENALDLNKTVLEEATSARDDLVMMEKEVESLREEIESGNNGSANRYALLRESFEKAGGYEFRGRIKGVLKHMGFDENAWDIPVSKLSGGQKTRLAMVKLILREPDIMLLDEPTNHLDTESVEWLETYLRAYKKTVLIISHDRYFLDRTATKILEIENGKGKVYNGNYTQYVEQKKQFRDVWEKHYNNQQKEIARIEKYIEQQRRWNRERNIIAAESRQKLLDKMEKIERPDELPGSVRMKFTSSSESGNDVLKLRGVSKAFGEVRLFSGVTFEVKKREHVFLIGQNGCGKSTLMKIIAERMKSDSGTVEYGYNVISGYYDQENQDLRGENTVLEELWSSHVDLTQTEIRNALALFLFRGDDVWKNVSELSGGEKARLTLCKLIMSKMNLLILDEPTNHLDINSREALESALSEFDGTVIAVSHDRYFISKLADRILSFENGKIVDFRGSYDEYCEFKKNRVSGEESVENPKTDNMTPSKKSYMENKKEQSDIRKQERKIKSAREEVEKIEKRITEIDSESERFASDYVKMTELFKEKETLEERLLELYDFLG